MPQLAAAWLAQAGPMHTQPAPKTPREEVLLPSATAPYTPSPYRASQHPRGGVIHCSDVLRHKQGWYTWPYPSLTRPGRPTTHNHLAGNTCGGKPADLPQQLRCHVKYRNCGSIRVPGATEGGGGEAATSRCRSCATPAQGAQGLMPGQRHEPPGEQRPAAAGSCPTPH